MSTVNLVTSSTLTTNRVRINLYKEPDRTAIIDSLTVNNTSGIVPEHTWVFYNLLPSQGYLYRFVEIDSNGVTIQQYLSQNFTTPKSGGIEVRSPEDITADVTTGFTSGTNTVVLDGSGGKPDFRGWEIIPFEVGSSIMEKLTQYTWEQLTGTFTRTDRNFEVNERYPIQFQPRKINDNAVVIRDAWSGDIIVNSNIVFAPQDIGQKAWFYGTGNYIKGTLPDIFQVVPSRHFYLEVPSDANVICAEIECSGATNNGNRIMWPKPGKNNLYIKRGEKLAIYRQLVSSTVSFWRVDYPDGNWKQLGEIIGEYTDTADVINKLALTDATYNNLDEARFYNHYILGLPSSEVVAFADWTTGTNRYKYSLADSNGNFHVPDLRNLYMRGSGTLQAGSYLKSQNLRHNHAIATTASETTAGTTADPIRGRIKGSPNNAGAELVGATSDADFANYTIKGSGGDEANPNSFVANWYVRC